MSFPYFVFRMGLLIAIVTMWGTGIVLLLRGDWIGMLLAFGTGWLLAWLDNRFPVSPIPGESRRARERARSYDPYHAGSTPWSRSRKPKPPEPY